MLKLDPKSSSQYTGDSKQRYQQFAARFLQYKVFLLRERLLGLLRQSFWLPLPLFPPSRGCPHLLQIALPFLKN